MIKSDKHKWLLAVLLLMAFMLIGCNKEDKKNNNDKATGEVSGAQDANDADGLTGDNKGDDTDDTWTGYMTNDGSVKLGNYKALEYIPVETVVSEAELDECMKETLAYFQEFMEIEVLTNELVAEYYDGFETVDELKEGFRVILAEEKRNEAEYNHREQIINELIAHSEVYEDLTEQAVNAYDSLVKHYNAGAVALGMKLEDYMYEKFSLEADEWEIYLANEASEMVVKSKILLAVAEAENLSVSESEYEERVAVYMEYYGYEERQIFEYEFSVEAIKQYMLEDIAMEYLISMAVPVDEAANN